MQQLIKNRRKHLPVLFALLGIVLFVNLFSTTVFHTFSLTLSLKMNLGYQPQTRIILPPIGQIRAQTHWLPIRLSLELKNVDLAILRDIVFAPPFTSEEMLKSIRTGILRMLVFFAFKLVSLGSLGAVFFLLFVGIRDTKRLLWGGISGALVLLLIVLMLYGIYDLSAFERLEYEGMIEAAPWALNLAWETLGKVEELGLRVQALASNLYSVLQQLENRGPIDLVKADVLVLHVSDIHNNPIAYNFAKQVTDSFPVDFIVDTGDLTDWGTALEAEIISRIESLEIPYLFVSGNHDSPAVLRRLSLIPNAVLITEQVQIFSGLRIAGTGDLVADSYSPTPASLDELSHMAKQLNEKWELVENRPDIFMVHNHRVAEAVKPGLFPVVLYGHTHAWALKQIKDTVYVNAGTTGAAGIRGFQSKEPLPYSLSLLYFTRNAEGNLLLEAVDGVHVTGLGTSFSLQRTFVDSGRNPTDDVERIR